MNAVLRHNLFVFLLILLGALFLVVPTAVYASTPEVTVVAERSALNTPIVYGPVSISVLAQPLERLHLAPFSQAEDVEETFIDKVTLVSVAEAAIEPAEVVIENFLEKYGQLKTAASLEHLQSVVTQESVLPLQEKLAAGVQEIMMVEMLKSMFPDMDLEVYDSRVSSGEAVLAVRDAQQRQDVQGIIVLHKEEGMWKIHQAQWFTDPEEIQKPNPLDLVESTLLMNYTEGMEPVGMKAQWEYTPYQLDHNLLSLQRISKKFTKSSFVFVFVVERKKKPAKDTDYTQAKKTTSQLHILWTGPRQLVPQQRVYSDLRLPLDVSVAHYKQGYKTNALNLRLPRRKPKEVSFVIFCNF